VLYFVLPSMTESADESSSSCCLYESFFDKLAVANFVRAGEYHELDEYYGVAQRLDPIGLQPRD